jgi:hypothetical protein
MRIARIIGGITLALMGGVWILQGLNSQYAPQSFMTGSLTWVVIGAMAVVGGIELARRSWTSR